MRMSTIRIDDFTLSEGALPPRVLGLVVEWDAKHKKELIEDWERAQNEQTLNKIEPLEQEGKYEL